MTDILSATVTHADTSCPTCGETLIRANIDGLFKGGVDSWVVDFCGRCETNE